MPVRGRDRSPKKKGPGVGAGAVKEIRKTQKSGSEASKLTDSS